MTKRTIFAWAVLSYCLAISGERIASSEAHRSHDAPVSRTLPGGREFSFQNVNSHLCIGVSGASKSPGGFIQQFPCDHRANQRWRSHGELGVENVNSGLCMGVDHGSARPGASIRQFKCDGRANQRWTVRLFDDETTSFVNSDGLCIGVDRASGVAGAQLKQFKCDGRPNQRWARVEPPPAAHGSVLPKPVNMGSYGTYHFRFQLWRDRTSKHRENFLDWTAAQMMTELNSNFSHYFTFTGCGKHLHVGDRCRLNTRLAPDAPVEVIAVAPDGFALRSLPGHPEGAGRTIRFQFQRFTNAAEISSMSLVVDAWGPLGKGSLLGPLNSSTVAQTSWDIFQNNIRNRYPDNPPGAVI